MSLILLSTWSRSKFFFFSFFGTFIQLGGLLGQGLGPRLRPGLDNRVSFLADDYILREGVMWQNKKSSINQNICQLLTPGCCSNQSAVTECSQGSPKKYLRTSDLILYNRWQTKIIFYFPNSDTSWFILFAILFLIRQENIILSNPSKSVFLDAWHNKSVNFQTSKVLVIEFLFPI